jgi:hypothetical protein
MLEVHPPHAAIHGWRDFFIHIVTITIGLLIAIGLEQTVEYFHHLDQLQVARRELSAELDENRRLAGVNEGLFRKARLELDNDMRLLRASQASHAPPAAGLDYSWLFYRTPDGAWQTAKQNGALGLMPHAELHHYIYDYAVFAAFMDALTAANVQMEVAGAMARRAPAGSLSPRDVEELITATSESQGKLAFAARLLSFEQAGLKNGR